METERFKPTTLCGHNHNNRTQPQTKNQLLTVTLISDIACTIIDTWKKCKHKRTNNTKTKKHKQTTFCGHDHNRTN